jgi:hypothetical protein
LVVAVAAEAEASLAFVVAVLADVDADEADPEAAVAEFDAEVAEAEASDALVVAMLAWVEAVEAEPVAAVADEAELEACVVACANWEDMPVSAHVLFTASLALTGSARLLMRRDCASHTPRVSFVIESDTPSDDSWAV